VGEDDRSSGGVPPLSVFISYRRLDAAYAGRLYDELVDRLGQPQVFMDVEAIEAGADFAAVILEQVRGAGAVLAVVSPGWSVATDAEGRRRLDDPEDFVRRELEAALDVGTKIIPVLVQEAHMPAPGDLPDSIAPFAHRQAAVLSDRRWRAEVNELIDYLTGATPAPTSSGAPLEGGDRPTAGRSVTRYRTRFVGRAEDIDGIQQLLISTGSATIVGPGGVGKSRLAVEIARANEPDYRDGIALAELAAVEDPSLVVGVVATAVGASDFGREATLDGVVRYLARRQLLLILDNCEHVLDQAAIVAATVLEQCPDVHLLATSREALKIDGEAVWRLDPLPVPDPASLSTTDVAASSAVQLFADRAKMADRSFVLDERSAPVVVRIAEALDGLPLALEMAAASLRSLNLGELLDGIHSNVLETASERRSGAARQRTLSATVEWSYRLLTPEEQLLFERLSVFAGDFGADAVERVAGDGMTPGSLPVTIRRLVERSLVDRVDDEPGGRYRLLVTVRDVGRRRLAERTGDPTRHALVAWAVEVAEQHGRAVDRGDELTGLRVLDAEHPNLLAALAVTVEASDVTSLGRLAAALTPYWELRGWHIDATKWVDQALERLAGDSPLRAACLLAAARLLPTAAFDERRRLCREALAMSDRVDDDVLASAALASLGHIDLDTEDRDSARPHVEAALSRARAAGDPASIALALSRMARILQLEGDTAGQRELLDQAIELYDQLGNRRGQLWCLAEVGFNALTTDDVASATAAFERGLKLSRELVYPHGEAWMLDALGETAGVAGRFDVSCARFEEAHTIQVRLGDELNRGWSLGGLVRGHLRTSDLAGAVRWLDEFRRFLRGDLIPLYEYAFALRAGSVAVASGQVVLAAQIVGALDQMIPGKATATLLPIDLYDRSRLVQEVEAALDAATLTRAKELGRAVSLAALGREVVERS
jgi:predicted ATPase